MNPKDKLITSRNRELEAVLEALYGWPGILRELANVIERAAVIDEGDTLMAEGIALPHREHAASGHQGHEHAGSLKEDVITLERERMILALSENSYVQHRAARALGITPRQFGYRLKKYGIDPGALKHTFKLPTT